MKVLVVDDHAVVRAGLRMLLEQRLTGIVVREASTASEALEAVRGQRFDVIVLDLSLPGRGGLDVLKDIREVSRDARILVLTMHSEDEYALRAFRAGAAGYITKDSAPGDVVDAIVRVQGGGRYVSPVIAEKLTAKMSLGDAEHPHRALSDRELQVLQSIGRGMTAKDIAKELSLSEKTVATYRARILEKLAMKTTAELMRYAIRSGLVQ